MRLRSLASIACVACALSGSPTTLLADEADQVELAKKVGRLVDHDEKRLLDLFIHLHQNP